MTEAANRLTERATSRSRAGGGSGPAMITTKQLRVFLDGLTKLGYDVGTLSGDPLVGAADLDDPDALVACEAIERAVRGAVSQRPLANIAARLASVTPIGTHALLDYLILTCDTVGDGLVQLARHFHLTGAPATVHLHTDEDPVRVAFDTRDPFTAQYSTALVIHHFRTETDGRLRASFVSLTQLPDDHAALERQLGCSVRAPSPWNGVAIPRQVLGIPLRRRDAVLRRVLEGHARSVAASKPETRDSICVRVRQLLISLLGRGEPSIADVARRLAIAPRTLQRRLAAEGTSFQRVVDETRREAAERLLAGRSLALSEIAYLLGFSEPSAFHRAFKRWAGSTPLEFRMRKPSEPVDSAL